MLEQTRPALTPRQLEVARLKASGIKQSEICERLGITQGTLTATTNSIYNRLGVRSVLGLYQYFEGIDAVKPHSAASYPSLDAVPTFEPLK